MARKENPTKRPRGRPSKYRPEFVEQAAKLCKLGATDKELADFFEVSESTLNLWKAEHPEFSESLKRGKQHSDDRVEQSLYRRAIGYTHDAVKIISAGNQVQEVPYVEHYAPDTTACIFWLKNRRPELWRDKTEADVKHGVDDSLAELLKAIDGKSRGLPDQSVE